MAHITLQLSFLPNFTDEVRELVEAVFSAHQRSAKENSNVSTVTAINAAAGSGRFASAVVAAISTLGGQHAPVGDARELLLKATEQYVSDAVKFGMKLPGFGNSFFKGQIDPAWEQVAELVRTKFPKQQERLDAIQSWLKGVGKNLLPNAAIYTAIACEEAQVPCGTEELFFLLPRLPIWAELTT